MGEGCKFKFQDPIFSEKDVVKVVLELSSKEYESYLNSLNVGDEVCYKNNRGELSIHKCVEKKELETEEDEVIHYISITKIGDCLESEELIERLNKDIEDYSFSVVNSELTIKHNSGKIMAVRRLVKDYYTEESYNELKEVLRKILQ